MLVVADGSGLDAGGFVAATARCSRRCSCSGSTCKNRKERIDALEERAEALEREKEEEARRAVADERLHIARELHDVVAHSMGVIAVQASVGEHVIDDNPAEAKRALEAISGVSRSTLAEIRRMLGVLRETDDDDGGSPAYAPAPGLAELDRLVPRARRRGGPRRRVVRRRAGGAAARRRPHRVPDRAGGAHQRDEARGPGARRRCVVRYEPGALGLEIVDDGRGVNGRSEGRSGHGLVGMRERVAVYGGTLETGPKPGGGFRVAARLPYEEPA